MKIVAMFLVACLAASSSAAAPWPLIVRAAWLAGRWETDEPDRVIEEHWLVPRGDGQRYAAGLRESGT